MKITALLFYAPNSVHNVYYNHIVNKTVWRMNYELEFWDGFEDIRNLHYVRKPFIVKNYGEHLEHKNEISTLFDRAMDTGRQVIVLLPVNKEREKAGRKYERRQASRTSQA